MACSSVHSSKPSGLLLFSPGAHSYNTYVNALRVTTTQAAPPTVEFDLTASAGDEAVGGLADRITVVDVAARWAVGA